MRADEIQAWLEEVMEEHGEDADIAINSEGTALVLADNPDDNFLKIAAMPDEGITDDELDGEDTR